MKRFNLITIFLLISGSLSFGQITYFANQDISISLNPGILLFLDIETGNTGSSAASLPDWDISVRLGGTVIGTNANFAPVRTGSTNTSAIRKLDIGSPGDIVDGSSQFYAPLNLLGSSIDHSGAGSDQWLSNPGELGYIGFKFQTDGVGPIKYGWMSVTISNQQPGTIHEWAFTTSPTGLEVGVVPEPHVYALIIGIFALAPVIWLRIRQNY